MVPAMKTRTVQTRTAMVRRKGAVIQHMRPAETMIATVNVPKNEIDLVHVEDDTLDNS